MQPSDPEFDSGLDAQLRAIPVPEDLLRRVRWAALAEDADLDAVIRAVRVPAGLLGRLRQAALETDEGLDAALRHVPLPPAVMGQLRQVPRGHLWLQRLTRWAVAASLLIGIGLSYVGAMVGLLMAAYPAGNRPPTELATWTGEMLEDGGNGSAGFIAAVPSGRAAGDRATGEPQVAGPEIRLAEGAAGPRIRPPAIDLPANADLLLEGSRWSEPDGVLTSHSDFDNLSDLKLVPPLVPRGIDPPLVPGFPLRFWIEHGVNPAVFPAAHPVLQTSVVPLDIGTSSYELMRRYLEDDNLPLSRVMAKVIRTEEFLAAVDYEFPSPSRRALGLSAAAGPSPFGNPGLKMLQIGVQARQPRDQQHPPVRLVLAVDVSASMRWGGRLEMIRRAMGRVVEQMGPADLISLVAFSDQSDLLLEDAGRDAAEDLMAAVDWLSAQKSTNLGAGLRRAYSVAQHGSAGNNTRTKVVLLTDGRVEVDLGTAHWIEQRLAEAAGRGIVLEVVDLGQDEELDPQLASFARCGGGGAHRATTADQIGWALREIITEEPQLVAAGVRLKVHFNTKTVVAYRLLGHEAKAIAGLMPASPQADFHAGQWATALYEIQLAPGGGEEVAVAELSWQDPAGSWAHRRSVELKVRRSQFAASLLESPLSLQEAVLVAQAAEVLRQSPFARAVRGKSRSMAWVLALAEQVDSRLYRRQSFLDFIVLMRQADQAKPYRSGGRK